MQFLTHASLSIGLHINGTVSESCAHFCSSNRYNNVFFFFLPNTNLRHALKHIKSKSRLRSGLQLASYSKTCCEIQMSLELAKKVKTCSSILRLSAVYNFFCRFFQFFSSIRIPSRRLPLKVCCITQVLYGAVVYANANEILDCINEYVVAYPIIIAHNQTFPDRRRFLERLQQLWTVRMKVESFVIVRKSSGLKQIYSETTNLRIKKELKVIGERLAGSKDKFMANNSSLPKFLLLCQGHAVVQNIFNERKFRQSQLA